MVYWDDSCDLPPLQHLRIDPYAADTEEPTDEVRALVREVVSEHPRWINSPARIEAHLRRLRDITVPVKQVAGALAELREGQ
jgi:hypothetical protein